MKYILTIILIISIAKTKECKNIEIDFIKEKKITRINTKINNKIKYGEQTPTFSKKIFKTNIKEMKIIKGEWKTKKFKSLKILNEKKINLKWSLFENELNIYAPQKEIIEKFKFKACY